MKLKHWVFLAFALIGAMYLLHIYTSHGGMTGFRSGLKLGG